MLIELGIHDFAIISDLSLTFEEGMSALTGETGAGKSIIIDAVSLLLGARGSLDYIRKGAKKCVLEGLFTVPKQPEFQQLLEENGLTVEEEGLILQREIHQNGKNICRLNGHLLSISLLKKIGIFLVDIQGQHDHQALLQPEAHLQLLDEYGKEKITPLKTAYQKDYQDYKVLARKVQQLQKNEKAFAQRIDMLQYQTEEIEKAALNPQEEIQLEEEKNKLGNYQKIVDVLSGTYQKLAGENNLLDELGESMNLMEDIASIDSEYEEIYHTLSSAFYSVQEALSSVSSQVDELEWDENRLNEVENRLELIYQLKRKYGESIPAILDYYQKISTELADASFAENPEALAQELQKAKEKVFVSGKKLQEMRENLAQDLSQKLKKELKALYMDHTQFQVNFTDLKEEFNSEGLYKGEFYIQTNVGEDLKPLVKVASGGELSRILLGLKSLFTKNLGVTSIVFDEVDTGVSGRVAKAIADKIHQIAQTSQVLCITHLPQVAAVADNQYLIEKHVEQGRTKTTVNLLKEKERIEVLAKMLAGSEVTSLSLEHAKELLKK